MSHCEKDVAEERKIEHPPSSTGYVLGDSNFHANPWKKEAARSVQQAVQLSSYMTTMQELVMSYRREALNAFPNSEGERSPRHRRTKDHHQMNGHSGGCTRTVP